MSVETISCLKPQQKVSDVRFVKKDGNVSYTKNSTKYGLFPRPVIVVKSVIGDARMSVPSAEIFIPSESLQQSWCVGMKARLRDGREVCIVHIPLQSDFSPPPNDVYTSERTNGG